MKKLTLALFNLIMFLTNICTAQEIQFIFPDSVSCFVERLTWLSPNEYRLPIYLNGSWEYQIKNEGLWKKTQIPSFCNFQGEIYFRKIFNIDSSYTEKLFKLVCYGINYYCNIFINDNFIGSHAGGYSSFAVDVPQNYLKIGKSNNIQINVKTNLDNKNTIPLKNQFLGQKNWGGILRDVYLLALPKITIQMTGFDHEFSENYATAKINVFLNIQYQSEEKNINYQKLKINVELCELESSRSIDIETVAVDEEKASQIINAEINIEKPLLWSPEFPNLYVLKVYLLSGKQIIDATSQLIGLKDLIIIDNDFYLNGQRIVLKGINWYENYMIGNQFLLPENRTQDIDYIKELNANAVRTVGHPPDPYWIELCDRHGLFLLEEIPLNYIPSMWLKNEQYLTYAFDYLTELISRDKDHVSVLAWGIGGPYDTTAYEVVNSLGKLAMQLDDRPLYLTNSDANIGASYIAGIDIFNIGKDLFNSRILDWQEANNKRPVIIISFGAPLREGLTNINNPRTFQEKQALKITEAYQIFQQYPKLDGYFVNSLIDWQCNYPLINYGIRTESNIFPSGLIDYHGNKHLAFDAIRSLYGKAEFHANPELPIKSENPSIFPVIGVISLLIFLFLYNTRNYFQENLKRIYIHPHGFYVDLRDRRKIPVSQTFLIAVFISLGLGLVSATFCYFYRENPVFDHIATLFLINPQLKQKLIILCWKPALSILIFMISFLVFFLVLGIFIKLFAIIFRKKIPIGQAITMAYWVGSNYLFLVPIGMILYRILLIKILFIPILILLAVIDLWFFARLIKAVKVVYFWSFFKTTLFVVIVVAISIVCVIYYYQQNVSILDYLRYYWGLSILTF